MKKISETKATANRMQGGVIVKSERQAYLTVDGQKFDISSEQLIKLGINPVSKKYVHTKTFVDDVVEGGNAYTITSTGRVRMCKNTKKQKDSCLNFRTKETAEQINMAQLLFRKLTKFENDYEYDVRTNKTDENRRFYYITKDTETHQIKVRSSNKYDNGLNVYFMTPQAAQDAIKKVVVPFLSAHPQYKW